MARPIGITAATLVAGAALISSAYGLAPKGVKKAPPRKPPVSNTGGTLGAKAFSGENEGQIGRTYTLGKARPMNITLDRVAYSVGTVRIGDRAYLPKADEKLLLIQYTAQNPLKQEQLLRHDVIHWFVVDAKDVNHENTMILGVPDTNDEYRAMLKPTQKKTVFTYIVIPADLTVPKLVAKSSDNLVIRYDLHNKIKPLAAPFADPKDPSGATALAEVPASFGQPYQIGGTNGRPCDLTIDGVAFSDATKMFQNRLRPGRRYLVMTASYTYLGGGDRLFRSDTFRPAVVTTDGETFEAESLMLHPTNDRDTTYQSKTGEGGRFRMVFQVPKDSKIAKLLARINVKDRTYVYDVSNVN